MRMVAVLSPSFQVHDGRVAAEGDGRQRRRPAVVHAAAFVHELGRGAGRRERQLVVPHDRSGRAHDGVDHHAVLAPREVLHAEGVDAEAHHERAALLGLRGLRRLRGLRAERRGRRNRECERERGREDAREVSRQKTHVDGRVEE
jgi:hypothetical protein